MTMNIKSVFANKNSGGTSCARSFRKVPLLLCLALAFVFAIPAQAQLLDCGLPAGGYAAFTSNVTFTLTDDCSISYSINAAVSSVIVTVNGNGHTITKTNRNAAFAVTNSASTLNLNNVVVTGGFDIGSSAVDDSMITVRGTLNANGVTIINSGYPTAIGVGAGGAVTLTDIQIINNREAGDTDAELGSALSVHGVDATTVTVNGAIFRGNRGQASVIYVKRGTLNLGGRICFQDNKNAAGGPAENYVKSDHATETNVINIQADAVFFSCPEPKKKKKKEEPTPAPTATPRPQYGASYLALQTETGMIFRPNFGLDSGIHFRQLDGAGIGRQELIDAGYLAALDVYGYVDQGVEICFPQVGRVVFLDAATSPRTMSFLTATVTDGMTCVAIERPGALVLLPPE